MVPGVPDISAQVFCVFKFCMFMVHCNTCVPTFLIGRTADDSCSAEGVIRDYFGRQSMGGWSRLWNDNCDINTCWN